MRAETMTRRKALSLAGAAALAVLATGARAQAVPIRAISVTGTKTRTLRQLAALLAEELPARLGPRYVPGARGGATLAVTLTTVVLDSNDNAFADPAIDTLDGRVTILDARGRSLSSFPLLVSSSTPFASVLDIHPDPRRLRSLAETYAYWTAHKLD